MGAAKVLASLRMCIELARACAAWKHDKYWNELAHIFMYILGRYQNNELFSKEQTSSWCNNYHASAKIQIGTFYERKIVFISYLSI